MNNLKQIFAVSFIAIAMVSGAHATILSKDSIVQGSNVTVNKPTTGTNAGKVVISGPTVNDKTITIQRNGTQVDTFTTNASANKTINITVGKSDVGLGNVDNTSDADKPVSTATQTALDAKEAVANKVTKDGVSSGQTLTSEERESTTLYPSMVTAKKIAADEVAGANSNVTSIKNKIGLTGNNFTTMTTTATTLTGAINELDSDKVDVAQGSGNANKAMVTNASGQVVPAAIGTSGSGNVVTGVSIASGAVTVAKANVQIPVGGENITNNYASIWVE